MEDTSEQITKAIGEWGKYQLRRGMLILVIIWLPASFHLLNMVYYTSKTDFYCKRPEGSNLSIAEWTALSHMPIANTDPVKYDACKIKSNPFADGGMLDESDYIPCTEFEYDTSFWKSTVIMDFHLVCERESYTKFTQQVTFFGLMCGVFTAGLLSDRFGRRPTSIGLLILTIVAGTGSSFSPNYPLFLLSVWICGFASIGYGTVLYVWLMEHVAGRYKTVMGAAPHYCFGFWGLAMSLICYLVPNWRHLQLIFSLPCLVLLIAHLYIPESPRWLLSKGRKQEAEEQCRMIARANGRELDESFELVVKQCEKTKHNNTLATFFQLFRSRNLRLKTLICYYTWFATALVYYGLTLNSNGLGASVFVYMSIGKLLEFPAITIVIFLLLHSGRRITLIIFYSICGISLILTMFIPLNQFPYEWPIVVLNLIGRVCAIGTLATCYIYSSEIFPTVVRNVGLGSSSVWARVSPMVAPYVAQLAYYDERIPITFFGVIALIAAVAVTFLPETSHVPLPDTIEESEEQGKGDTFWASLASNRAEKTRK